MTAPPEVSTWPDPDRRTAAGRVLAVLGAFDSRHRLLSLSEIARRGGLTLPTAHRLVGELVAFGALERGPDGRYGVGLRLLELSALAPRGLHLREAAFPYIDALRRRTRGNVHLGVRDGSEVVYVDAMRTLAGHRINSLNIRAGDRWPMHATGTGLALLAHSDPDVQEEVIEGRLEVFNERTVADPHDLRVVLAEVRRTGAAVDCGQVYTAVSVPVLDPSGGAEAAVTVMMESERARPRELVSALQRASRLISQSVDRTDT
jgi:DNA-binding IclR family transcriptional regulator